MLYLIKAVAGISCLVILHRWIGDLGLLLMGCISGIMYQSLLPIFDSKRDLFIGERPGMFHNTLFLIFHLIIVQNYLIMKTNFTLRNVTIMFYFPINQALLCFFCRFSGCFWGHTLHSYDQKCEFQIG